MVSEPQIFARRLLLPILALLAVVFAPAALALHESLESAKASIHAHTHHGHSHGCSAEVADSPSELWLDLTDQPEPLSDVPEPSHSHDSAHCGLCASVISLKQVTILSAFTFAVLVEPAPAFVVPTYLAPTTGEHSMTLAIPRGPPAIA